MTNSRKRWRNLSILTDNNIGIENKAFSYLHLRGLTLEILESLLNEDN
ncbi:MAG: hypothetical protein ACKPA9_15755 [Microcystis sp.]